MIRIYFYFCFCFCLFALTRRPAVVMATWRALSCVDRSIVGGEGRWRADEGTVPVTLRASLCVCTCVCACFDRHAPFASLDCRPATVRSSTEECLVVFPCSVKNSCGW